MTIISITDTATSTKEAAIIHHEPPKLSLTILDELDAEQLSLISTAISEITGEDPTKTHHLKLTIHSPATLDDATSALISRIGLKSLSLSLFPIVFSRQKQSFSSLAKLIETNQFEELDFSDMRMGNGGLANLKEALGKNTNLRRLNLTNNDITDGVAPTLAEILKQNKGLVALNLSLNKVNREGLEILIAATELRELNLRFNEIKEGDILARILEQNPKLEVLNLSNNELNYHELLKIANALHHNTNLKSLSISFQDYTLATDEIDERITAATNFLAAMEVREILKLPLKISLVDLDKEDIIESRKKDFQSSHPVELISVIKDLMRQNISSPQPSSTTSDFAAKRLDPHQLSNPLV